MIDPRIATFSQEIINEVIDALKSKEFNFSNFDFTTYGALEKDVIRVRCIHPSHNGLEIQITYDRPHKKEPL